MSKATVKPQVVTPAEITLTLTTAEASYILTCITDMINYSGRNMNEVRNSLRDALHGSKEQYPEYAVINGRVERV